MNVSHDDIARRAYEIYLRSGMLGGRCTVHWLQAEYELRRQQLRDALMSEWATPVSQDGRYSELLNGRNPRADARLMGAIAEATPGKAKRGRQKSQPKPNTKTLSTEVANDKKGASP
jgi:hypothetical protein